MELGDLDTLSEGQDRRFTSGNEAFDGVGVNGFTYAWNHEQPRNHFVSLSRGRERLKRTRQRGHAKNTRSRVGRNRGRQRRQAFHQTSGCRWERLYAIPLFVARYLYATRGRASSGS